MKRAALALGRHRNRPSVRVLQVSTLFIALLIPNPAEGRLAQVESTTREIKDENMELQAKMEQLGAQFDELGGELRGRIDGLEVMIDGLEVKMDGIENQLATILGMLSLHPRDLAPMV